MEKNYDDTFLARWAAEELTPEELSKFKESKAYSEYKKINEGVNRLEAPSYDRQKAWELLKETISDKPKKLKKRIPIWSYAAASVLIVLGYFFFMQETTYTSPRGEISNFELPDGSNLALNAGATVTFKTLLWKNNRKLKLEGEAFFDVKKGSAFEVHTNHGTIEVLGTQFSVNSRINYLDVQCFEGSVKVNVAENSFNLIAGKAVRYQDKTTYQYTFTDLVPSWTSNETVFANSPILVVIEALEQRFDITIDASNIDETQKFTGRFSHLDINTALQTVFDAMELAYTFDGEANVTILK